MGGRAFLARHRRALVLDVHVNTIACIAAGVYIVDHEEV
jgi:hypothetical protein